jgi:hypothetical protein
MAPQPLYGKGQQPVLWAGSWAASGKITISGIPSRQNYFYSIYIFTMWPRVA